MQTKEQVRQRKDAKYRQRMADRVPTKPVQKPKNRDWGESPNLAMELNLRAQRRRAYEKENALKAAFEAAQESHA